MEQQEHTYRAVYDNGEIRFVEPMHLEGEWEIRVTFLQRLDDRTVPVEGDPHRYERGSFNERLEEVHRTMETTRPRSNPY